jgi:hypothetical protein
MWFQASFKSVSHVICVQKAPTSSTWVFFWKRGQDSCFGSTKPDDHGFVGTSSVGPARLLQINLVLVSIFNVDLLQTQTYRVTYIRVGCGIVMP